MEIGQQVRNKNTGQIETIHAIDEVLTYNPSTKQKDKVIHVYILDRKNRWNQQLLHENWELVDEKENEVHPKDYLYGVSYDVESSEEEE